MKIFNLKFNRSDLLTKPIPGDHGEKQEDKDNVHNGDPESEFERSHKTDFDDVTNFQTTIEVLQIINRYKTGTVSGTKEGQV